MSLDKRRKEVNQLLERKCLVEKLGFIDNQNPVSSKPETLSKRIWD